MDCGAVPTTRRWAVATLRSWLVDLPDSYADTAALVVSELVTNAVTHAAGSGPVTVDLWLTPRGNLAVQVADGSPTPPSPRRPYDDDTRGRGLTVIATETIAWGWRPDGKGKFVFATIAMPGTRPPDIRCRTEVSTDN
ncbi:ATP-binding protein [Kitasatospora sp. NPDC052896]|uniref:ATP-binding protein n=1 Tax=Kitasatospora sp. NPDC052896 TaxID=3364061 RepID=UPI0037C646F0